MGPLYKPSLNDHNSISVCARGKVLTILESREDELHWDIELAGPRFNHVHVALL